MADHLTKLKKALADAQTVQSVVLWAAACLAGFIAVEYAQLFRRGESAFEHFFDLNPAWVFVISPISLTLSAWSVLRFSPEAAGSGIPQVLAAHEHGENAAKRLLSLRVALIKLVSSLLAVLGGGAIGREGPTLQIAACIFHRAGLEARKRFSEIHPKIWIVAGAAAGLASAFNTPLGGIVYAIEEFANEQFHKLKMPLISCVIFAGLISQWLLGPYLYFGFPKLHPVSLATIGPSMLIGLVAGGLGGVFGRVLGDVMSWRSFFSFRLQLTVAFVCGLIVAALIYVVPAAKGSGIPLVNDLLFKNGATNWIQFLARFATSLFTYFAGVAGGIFAPSLSLGGILGALAEDLFQTGAKNLMVLLGMIGFLTGVTRTPFTAFILVLEMTDRHSAIFPMMVTALSAQSIARFLFPTGFYEQSKARWMPHP